MTAKKLTKKERKRKLRRQALRKAAVPPLQLRVRASWVGPTVLTRDGFDSDLGLVPETGLDGAAITQIALPALRRAVGETRLSEALATMNRTGGFSEASPTVQETVVESVLDVCRQALSQADQHELYPVWAGLAVLLDRKFYLPQVAALFDETLQHRSATSAGILLAEMHASSRGWDRARELLDGVDLDSPLEPALLLRGAWLLHLAGRPAASRTWFERYAREIGQAPEELPVTAILQAQDALPEVPDRHGLVQLKARYLQIRKTEEGMFELVKETYPDFTGRAFEVSATKLGLLHRVKGRKTFIGEEEDFVYVGDMAANCYPAPHRNFFHLLIEGPAGRSAAEMAYIIPRASARLTPFVLLETYPEFGARILDLGTGLVRLIMDTGMSQYAGLHPMLGWSRLLDFDDFVMTTGAIVPVSPSQGWLAELSELARRTHLDVPPLPGHAIPRDLEMPIMRFLIHRRAEDDSIDYQITDPS